MDRANRVMSGTWGELWLDDEKFADVYKFQAKRTANKEKIALCGQMATDTKTMSTEGTGSIGFYKTTSFMNRKVGDALEKGQDPRFTLIGKLDDPDAYGAERVAIYNVSFDDETVADWEASAIGKIEAPFTWTRREFLDTVEV